MCHEMFVTENLEIPLRIGHCGDAKTMDKLRSFTFITKNKQRSKTIYAMCNCKKKV